MAILDETDREILELLLEDGGRSKAEIARSVGLTPNAIFERLRKLHKRHVIRGVAVRLDPRALGFKLLAYVFVEETKPTSTGKTGRRLTQVPSVEEVHRVAGRDCFLLKIRAADTDELTSILDEIGKVESVGSIKTTIVLETYLEKSFDALPNRESER